MELSSTSSRTWAQSFGKGPAWMEGLGEIVGYVDPPSWRDYFFIDEKSNVRVHGEADLILKMADGRLMIVDCKTAQPKGNQDRLAPTYKIQQTAYAIAAEYQGLGEVAGASLLYFTAQAGEDADFYPKAGQDADMIVPFKTALHPLKLDEGLISGAPGCLLADH